MVLRVRTGPTFGFLCVLGLLTALDAIGGLGVLGWLTGIACGAGTGLVVAHGAARLGVDRLGPADLVTLTRVVLSCAVAALAAAAFIRPAAVGPLVMLASVALALDFVDGRVARHTQTASAFGARFDMETDAFLILVLSVYAAHTTGWWWVLFIGLARYVFVVARRVFPWLRGSVPPRFWCKVVAALQGVVLIVAATAVVPKAWMGLILVVALLLLVESFGREGWQLWRAKGNTGCALIEVSVDGSVRNG